MTHFACLVVADTQEEALQKLAPYCEKTPLDADAIGREHFVPEGTIGRLSEIDIELPKVPKSLAECPEMNPDDEFKVGNRIYCWVLDDCDLDPVKYDWVEFGGRWKNRGIPLLNGGNSIEAYTDEVDWDKQVWYWILDEKWVSAGEHFYGYGDPEGITQEEKEAWVNDHYRPWVEAVKTQHRKVYMVDCHI